MCLPAGRPGRPVRGGCAVPAICRTPQRWCEVALSRACRGHAAAGKGRTPSVVRQPGESRRAAAGLACQCRAESLQPSRQTFQAAMPVEAA